MAELSIGQVAKQTGVSARMLRHYDKIGLFTPSRVSPNGHRWYDTRSLPRLHRIIALRRAGLGLTAIADVVANEETEAGTLRRHVADLKAERDRLTSLIEAMEDQITQLDATAPDTPTARGSHDTQSAAFASRLEDEFGPGAAAELRADQLGDLSDADVTHVIVELRQVMNSFAALMTSGRAPTSPQAHDLVGRHFALTTRYWPTDVTTNRRLGRLYETDPLQRGIAAGAHPDLPSWLARAIESYADKVKAGTDT